MGNLVVSNAMCKCSFGAAPMPLLASRVVNATAMNLPAATIFDLPTLPFGMCFCQSNPAVIAATAAALGVFTPAPCTPAVVAPWSPGSPTVMFGQYPALNNTSTASCIFGGVIQIVMTPAVTVQVP